MSTHWYVCEPTDRVPSCLRKNRRRVHPGCWAQRSRMYPSPHIWCAGAGSGLGRRSDRPNEISQHTKCLSGPIRIPSCLPWVYLIGGSSREARVVRPPLAHKFLGLAWAGQGWARMGWVGRGLQDTIAPQRACFYSLPLLPLFITVTSSDLHRFFFLFFFLSFLLLIFFSFSLPLFTSIWDLGNF